jgi:hypothetical protein
MAAGSYEWDSGYTTYGNILATTPTVVAPTVPTVSVNSSSSAKWYDVLGGVLNNAITTFGNKSDTAINVVKSESGAIQTKMSALQWVLVAGIGVFVVWGFTKGRR